jgi:hypothetical protein
MQNNCLDNEMKTFIDVCLKNGVSIPSIINYIESEITKNIMICESLGLGMEQFLDESVDKIEERKTLLISETLEIINRDTQ